MKHISEKVRDGVLDLSKVPTATLVQWAMGAPQADKDAVGHDVMYRE